MKDSRRAGLARQFLASALLQINSVATRLFGRDKERHTRALELIKESSLFDVEWYLRTYPDVADARLDPLDHYLKVGWREGRDPGPDFRTSSYLKANRDVAMADVNPLLHFLEFGYQEGRGPFTHLPSTKQFTLSLTEFGPAAPCVSFPLPEEPSLRWTRGYRLRPSRNLVCAGHNAIGYTPDETTRRTLESSLLLLAAISGYSGAGAGAAERLPLPQSTGDLLDAWYVNVAQLRTRWHSNNFPFVIRAFQHDPLSQGMLCQVGEGLVASPIDALDLNLRSPYFPVLLVMAAPDGTVRGAQVLPFPSLCRGGTHYSELLHSGAANAKTRMDALKTGELLSMRLLRLFDPSVSPAIRRIDVDIRGGDGRGLMFQSEFQLWLSKVFGVSVGAIGSGQSVSDFLAQAIRLSPSAKVRERGAILRVNHNMAPTIAALVEADTSEAEGLSEVAAPFLVAGFEARQPAVAIEFPRRDLGIFRASGHLAARFPCLVEAGRTLAERFPVAAIVSWEHRDISDAALFVPVADLAVSADTRPAVTWVVETQGWSEGALAQAAHALSLQNGGDNDCLSFVGSPDRFAEFLAATKVRHPVHCFHNLEAAIAAADTPMVGFLGPLVVLHDARTTHVLVSLLDNESVATASCAIVNVDHAEVNWHATVADGGSLLTPSGGRLEGSERELVTAFLWGSNYPVTVPGPHLWLARKSSLIHWLERAPRQLREELHICTSMVSASCVGSRYDAQLPAFLPKSESRRTTGVRAAFG